MLNISFSYDKIMGMGKVTRAPGQLGAEVVAIIREKMGRQRILQADLARLTSIPQSTLSRTLDGKREIGIDEVQAIGSALKTTGSELVNEAARRLREESVN